MRIRFAFRDSGRGPGWAATALLVWLAAACTGDPPPCAEDWLGEVCANDEGVHRVTSTELGSVSELVLGDEALLWRLDVNPATGEPLFAIQDATIACGGDESAMFAVLQSQPPGVLFLASESGTDAAFHGGAGEGPQEFSGQVRDVLAGSGCRVAVYDRSRHRVSWVDPVAGVDTARVLPSPTGAGTLHELVGALADGTLVGMGLRAERIVTPEDPADMEFWKRLGTYSPGDRRWETILEPFAHVELGSTTSGYGPSPFRPASLVWTEHDLIWVTNGHWPVARAFGPEGRLERTIWLDLPRQPITDADWTAFRDGYSRAFRDDPEVIRRRWEVSELFRRPERGPHFHEALAVTHGMVWLRMSEDEYGGWGSRWLVLRMDNWTPLFEVQLPPSSRPLAWSGRVLLVQVRGPRGETEFVGYRLTDPRAG